MLCQIRTNSCPSHHTGPLTPRKYTNFFKVSTYQVMTEMGGGDGHDYIIDALQDLALDFK